VSPPVTVVTPEDVVARAQELADAVLFPRALETDAAPLAPRATFDALAEAGLYGVVAPVEAGGLGADAATWFEITEIIAGGCLTTAFVWVQHFGGLWAAISTEDDALRQAWLRPLATGKTRGGIAIRTLRPGPSPLRAIPADASTWVFDGPAPFVTGWGLIDVLYTAARTDDGRTVWAMLDAVASDTLSAQPLPLVAGNGSGTVELTFRRHAVPPERVFGITPYVPPELHDGGGRLNGALALGVARRCCRLIGESPLDDQLIQARARLDDADEMTMAAARAAACELAARASSALIVSRGSSSILSTDHAQRLAREALFLLTFGTRPAIQSSLVELLTRGSRPA